MKIVQSTLGLVAALSFVSCTVEAFTATTLSPKASTKPIERRDPGFDEWLLQEYQVWALQNPDNIISRLTLPIISNKEGIDANFPAYLPSKRRAFGNNFCMAGQVVLGDFEEIERAITSPQERTFRLGSTRLDSNTLPMGEKGGRNVFLLALSNKEASGNGDYEAFRSAIVDNIIREDVAIERGNDATSDKLFDKLAKDYIELDGATAGSEFFTRPDAGMPDFFNKYLHYVLFGIDPDDEEKINAFKVMYYESKVMLNWWKWVNVLLKIKGEGTNNMIDTVAKFYEESPALQNYPVEGMDKYNGMTKSELAQAIIPIMGIAALVGPSHLFQTAMGFQRLPAYEGHEELADFNVTDVFDSLDLGSKDQLKNYLYECGRLYNPVSASHRVATEEFTVDINGKDRTFPAGTCVNIPMIFAMQDEDFWKTPYNFDMNRESLCPFSMIFNSVGDRGGRICPGRGIALDMLTKMLQTVGKVRRKQILGKQEEPSDFPTSASFLGGRVQSVISVMKSMLTNMLTKMLQTVGKVRRKQILGKQA